MATPTTASAPPAPSPTSSQESWIEAALRVSRSNLTSGSDAPVKRCRTVGPYWAIT
jgi:hypothetical protein